MNRANPFFLDAKPGKRFCLYHPPQGPCRGCVLFVPPFAEEMNKSRRMVAIQARALSALGYAVLSVDLYGCGDSSGDFRDARWEAWKEDLALAVKWLGQQHDAPVTLWGLRLGVLLALDFARNAAEPIERFILWQPVHGGETYLTQFLRLRVANAMIAGKEKTSSKDLRHELASNGTLEVAGYDLPHELACAIDRIKLADLGIPGAMHHWFEIAPGVESALSPAVMRVIEAWESRGMPVQTHKVPGEPFWSTQEITDCPDLIDRTSLLFSGAP
ncbi:MAG: hydrolase 2, exosortase A system-associated [Burkholderiales bacterium]|nr:hydrolase 2, exosortase A system-associated [Burkholderiales bacterium]